MQSNFAAENNDDDVCVCISTQMIKAYLIFTVFLVLPAVQYSDHINRNPCPTGLCLCKQATSNMERNLEQKPSWRRLVFSYCTCLSLLKWQSDRLEIRKQQTLDLLSILTPFEKFTVEDEAQFLQCWQTELWFQLWSSCIKTQNRVDFWNEKLAFGIKQQQQ